MIFRHKLTYDPMSYIKLGDKIETMDEHIKVLDHGYVEYKGHLGGEEDIIRAARMSTGKGFIGWEPGLLVPLQMTGPGQVKDHPGDEKLLEYLYRNGHHSPFEMLELRVEVKAPIFVFREWHRHRTQSYNEFSARYSQMPNEHYVPDIRWQDKKNKQGSLTATEASILNDDFRGLIVEEQDGIYVTYEWALDHDIAKEVARINTPVSRYSKMWAKANLRNWLHFLDLRLRPNAQLEIRQYAEGVASFIKFLWPRTYHLFEEYTLGAKSIPASGYDEIASRLNREVNELTTEDLRRIKEILGL